MDIAIQKANYQSKFQQNRHIIAKRILEKYCQSVQDHKNIFSQPGLSATDIPLKPDNYTQKPDKKGNQPQRTGLQPGRDQPPPRHAPVLALLLTPPWPGLSI